MLTLFAADVCPFAQRTRALLTLLDVPFALREIDLQHKPEDFVAISPTGKVPLLVDGELKLYESQVINDYLAEEHHFAQAYPDDVGERARVKLAMKQFDNVVLPAFYEGLRRPESFDDARRRKVGLELDEMERTIEQGGVGAPSLLALHVATFWLRWAWLREFSDVPTVIDDRPALRAWFDEAVARPEVQATAPQREPTVAAYRARYAAQRAQPN